MSLIHGLKQIVKRRAVTLALALTIAASGTGCAAMRAAATRHQYIQAQTQEHVFKKPIAEVWPSVRQLLFESEYSVKDTGEAGQFTLETDWLVKESQRSRYLVQAIKVDDSSCRVQFTRVDGQLGQNATRSSRDLQMEWKLLQQVEPQTATQIEGDAEREARKSSG